MASIDLQRLEMVFVDRHSPMRTRQRFARLAARWGLGDGWLTWFDDAKAGHAGQPVEHRALVWLWRRKPVGLVCGLRAPQDNSFAVQLMHVAEHLRRRRVGTVMLRQLEEEFHPAALVPLARLDSLAFFRAAGWVARDLYQDLDDIVVLEPGGGP